MRFGWPHRRYRVTDSTNERARELADAGAPSGTIVTAARQTAGRGRRGRAWSAPEGKSLLLSAILRPLGAEHSLLPLAAPVAVCEAIESIAPVECAIKWPNDIWIDERKVAGILIEARPPAWAVIGIGVNVAIEPQEFPGDLRWPATSIAMAAGEAPRLADVRTALAAALEAWVARPAPEVLEAFRTRDALAGREVSWEGAGDPSRGSGTAAGIDDQGNLIVEPQGAAPARLGAGEVSLRVAP